MTFSDATYNRAFEILQRVTTLLDEEVIAQLVDEPIENVLAEFETIDNWTWSHEKFHQIIAKFVQRLYAGTVFCQRRLSLAQAHDEAIALLEQAYAQMGGDGYDNAVLDAADPSHEGLQVVLTMMAEWIKAHRRETYRHWVLARHIDPSDWRAKCAIAKILIDHCREWMPPELCRLSLGQLTDAIPELLSIHLATNDPSRSFPADSSDQR